MLKHGPWGKAWGRFLRASGHNIFINSSTHNLVLCMLLSKDTLFNTHGRFVNSQQQYNSCLNKV